MNESQRHLLIAKVNVITEAKKLTTFSDTFSYHDMKLRFPLAQEYLNQKNPIIFQIVYTSEVRTYIFNVYGTVSSNAPMIVVFTKASHNVIFQFLTDVLKKKKIV
ncbi:hypothetical protein CIK05_08235 [Bdellovibrio sp. qaytius]|nr:hypothetical protein CIK05_08235 [Bdellovibrio sp. qaytius]